MIIRYLIALNVVPNPNSSTENGILPERNIASWILFHWPGSAGQRRTVWVGPITTFIWKLATSCCHWSEAMSQGQVILTVLGYRLIINNNNLVKIRANFWLASWRSINHSVSFTIETIIVVSCCQNVALVASISSEVCSSTDALCRNLFEHKLSTWPTRECDLATSPDSCGFHMVASAKYSAGSL